MKVLSKEELIDSLRNAHGERGNGPPEQVRAHMEAVVPGLNHWKK